MQSKAVVLPHIEPTSHSWLSFRYVLSTHWTGQAIELVMALMSVLSCVTFVWETYLEKAAPLWMFWAEVLFSMSFSVNYVVFL